MASATPGPSVDCSALPSAAVLSDAVKAAQTDVDEALRQDRSLERQRDCTGIVGVFQSVGVRLFAVSVALLLLLAAVLSANAALLVALLHVVTLAQALGVVFAVDIGAAVLIFALLLGRGRERDQASLMNRPFISTALLERMMQNALAFPRRDGGDDDHV